MDVRIKITMGPFEAITSINVDTAKFKRKIDEDFLSCAFAVGITSIDPTYKDGLPGALNNLQNSSALCYLACDEDYDKWLIYKRDDKDCEVYYLLSVSGTHTPKELFAYFQDAFSLET